MDTERLLQGYLTNGSYKNQVRCQRDIMNAINHYRALHPRLEKFTFNDGSQKDLVCLQGTIPVPYRGSNYNIPISIWVLDTHPLHAPMCYVCPTPEMQIKVSRHVDYNGKIYLPYLHEWNESCSDLLGLIQICIITFSEQPPVFARTSNSSSANSQPNYQPQQPAYGGGSNSQYSQQGSISDEYIRASLITAVEEKVRRMLREDFNTKQVEMESLRKIKEELQQSQNTIKASLESMQSEIAKMAEMTLALSRKKSELEEVRNSMKDGSETTDVDDLVQVVYPVYKQLMVAFAEDAAIDDSIYFLGEALRRGVIDCENFLKNIRNISRKQFFLRLTINKAREKARLDR